jgi:hypothetical protein
MLSFDYGLHEEALRLKWRERKATAMVTKKDRSLDFLIASAKYLGKAIAVLLLAILGVYVRGWILG